MAFNSKQQLVFLIQIYVFGCFIVVLGFFQFNTYMYGPRQSILMPLDTFKRAQLKKVPYFSTKTNVLGTQRTVSMIRSFEHPNYVTISNSTTKETHQSLLGAITEIRIKKWKYIYTIFHSNQFCIISLNNVTLLLKSVHAIRQCFDKGSFSKMTGFSLENEYLVLV